MRKNSDNDLEEGVQGISLRSRAVVDDPYPPLLPTMVISSVRYSPTSVMTSADQT